MKALSLGLVKGSIDQVDTKVHMTWVQPRVLDRNQVTRLISQINIMTPSRGPIASFAKVDSAQWGHTCSMHCFCFYMSMFQIHFEIPEFSRNI